MAAIFTRQIFNYFYFFRLKSTHDDILSKRTDVDHLLKESEVLSSWAKNDNSKKEAESLEKKWKQLLDECFKIEHQLELEILDCSNYHQSLQDLEKWVLQMSFQLMAHNSLYITNKAQTEEQISQHNELLQEILR